MIKKMFLVIVFVCGVIFELMGFGVSVSLILDNNIGAALFAFISFNILFGLPMTFYPGRKLFKGRNSLFASSVRKSAKLFKEAKDKDNQEVSPALAFEEGVNIPNTDNVEQNSEFDEGVEIEGENTEPLYSDDFPEDECQFCQNLGLWDDDALDQIYDTLVMTYKGEWGEQLADVDIDAASRNSWFLLRFCRGEKPPTIRSIPTGVFSTKDFNICDPCHVLLTQYAMEEYEESQRLKKKNKWFKSQAQKAWEKVDDLYENDSELSEAQKIVTNIYLWNGPTTDKSKLLSIKEKYISSIEENRDEIFDLLQDVVIRLQIKALLELTRLANRMELIRNTDQHIIDLLDKVGKNISAEEINKRLEFGNSDHIKETCENMYINGEIQRDGNHRYFSLSLENTTPATKSDYIKQIKDLGSLLEEGLITQAEFDVKKKELLG
jgi:hypothetical protein